MTADEYIEVEADGVILPSPEGGEKYTQLDCPDCSCPLRLTVETAMPDAVGVDMRLGVDWNVDAGPRSQLTQTLLSFPFPLLTNRVRLVGCEVKHYRYRDGGA